MIVALIGLVISVAAFLIAFTNPARQRIDIYAAVLVLHLAATGTYYLLAADAGYDAMFYYTDPLHWRAQPLQSGTVFVIQFVQLVKSIFGGGFFAHFVFFQAFGMVGCALLLRTMDEIAASFGIAVPNAVYLLLMLPGLHLWTVAIGKDAPLFMAVSLTVWASLRMSRRIGWMLLAVVIIGLIRPPVAVLVVIALAASLVFDRRLTNPIKIALGVASAIGLAAVLAAAQSQLEIATLDTQGITDFVERNQNLGQTVGGGADIVNLPYPAKFLSLLFRPFFFDAGGILGLIASFENLILLVLFAYLAYNIRTLIKLMQTVYFLTYSVLFSSVLFASLALLNYNVGLGLRQKMMGMPAILAIVAAIALYRRYQAGAVLGSSRGAATLRMASR